MAVNDTVALIDTTNRDIGSAQRTLIGAVNAETAGPPATSDVLWSTGALVSDIPQARLGKVFSGSDEAQALVGKYIQMLAFPQNAEGVGGTPKSPAFSGIVVATFRIAAYDAPDPGVAGNQLVVRTKSGQLFVFEDNSTPGAPMFVVNEGRRTV